MNEKSVMNNYFGIGIDAKISLDFHNKREENPKMLLQENKDIQQINKFLNLYPDQLSDGQRKKMNLFRSLIPNYELYLLDEPDIGLDKESIKDLNLLIDKIHKRGESIIFTSHNQNVLGIKNNISQTISL